MNEEQSVRSIQCWIGSKLVEEEEETRGSTKMIFLYGASVQTLTPGRIDFKKRLEERISHFALHRSMSRRVPRPREPRAMEIIIDGRSVKLAEGRVCPFVVARS